MKTETVKGEEAEKWEGRREEELRRFRGKKRDGEEEWEGRGEEEG